MSNSIYCNVGRHAPECGGEECSCPCHNPQEEYRGFTEDEWRAMIVKNEQETRELLEKNNGNNQSR